MSVSLSAFLTSHRLLLAFVVLFGGSVSTGMLVILLGNVYFLPGPPPRGSLRVGVATALLGAALTGLGVTLAVLGNLQWGSLWRPIGVIATGAAVYLVGLCWLELRARPDATW